MLPSSSPSSLSRVALFEASKPIRSASWWGNAAHSNGSGRCGWGKGAEHENIAAPEAGRERHSVLTSSNDWMSPKVHSRRCIHRPQPQLWAWTRTALYPSRGWESVAMLDRFDVQRWWLIANQAQSTHVHHVYSLSLPFPHLSSRLLSPRRARLALSCLVSQLSLSREMKINIFKYSTVLCHLSKIKNGTVVPSLNLVVKGHTKPLFMIFVQYKICAYIQYPAFETSHIPYGICVWNIYRWNFLTGVYIRVSKSKNPSFMMIRFSFRHAQVHLQ